MEVIEKVFPNTTEITSLGRLEIGGCDVQDLAQKYGFFKKIIVDSLNVLVRLERLELSMGIPTWPSTKPVYQFQHGRFMRQNI